MAKSSKVQLPKSIVDEILIKTKKMTGRPKKPPKRYIDLEKNSSENEEVPSAGARLGGIQKGTKHHRTRFFELLGEERADQVINMLWERAEIDSTVLMFIAERLHPKPKPSSYVRFDMENTQTMEGLKDTFCNLNKAVGSEEIALETATEISEMLQKTHKFLEMTDVQSQLTMLMNKVGVK